MEVVLVNGDPRDVGTGVCRLPVSWWEAAALPSWGAAVVVSLRSTAQITTSGAGTRAHGEGGEGSGAGSDGAVDGAACSGGDGPLLICTGWPTGDPADEGGGAYLPQAGAEGGAEGEEAAAVPFPTACTADPWVVYLPRRNTPTTGAACGIGVAEGVVAAVVAAIEAMQPVNVRVVGGNSASTTTTTTTTGGQQQQQQQQVVATAADSVVVRVLERDSPLSDINHAEDVEEEEVAGEQSFRHRSLMRAARRALLGQ